MRVAVSRVAILVAAATAVADASPADAQARRERPRVSGAMAEDAQVPTAPAPSVAPGQPCPGNLQLTWNVSSIQGADSIRWELRRGSDFVSPTGPDRQTVSGAGFGASGAATLDLREHGPVMAGERYYVRIVAVGGGEEVSQRSPSVLYDPQEVYSDFQLSPGESGGLQLSFTWGGGGQLRQCLDRVFYELKAGQPFTNPTGAEPGRLDGQVLSGQTGSHAVDLTPYGAGNYYLRVVGKYGGATTEDDVGRRGAGLPITVGATPTATATATATVTPTQPVATATTTATATATATITPTSTQPVSTATPTPTMTPTYTPTFVVTPTPTPTATATFTPTFTPSYTPTFTPSYTPTTPPAAQVAPEDPRFNNPLDIPLDQTISVLDFVSYPDGDTEDRVRYSVTGMNSNPSLPGGRARLVVAVSCFGTGTAEVQLFTGGQTYSCGQTVVDREVTADSDTGSIAITAVGGSGTYVQWVLTGTATRLN